jgi:type I restriction-modification system DNA methylase subunit
MTDGVSDLATKIIENLKDAQDIAQTEFNRQNTLQLGIIKELIMAKILGHQLVPIKADADAKDQKGNYYEYLTSYVRQARVNKGSSFQIDRITPSNLGRITRNKCFYFGFFRVV